MKRALFIAMVVLVLADCCLGEDGISSAQPNAVREIRGAFTRSFTSGFEAGIHFVSASGYTGQTLETLQFRNETQPTERVVGVRQASYAGITLTYRLHR